MDKFLPALQPPYASGRTLSNARRRTWASALRKPRARGSADLKRLTAYGQPGCNICAQTDTLIWPQAVYIISLKQIVSAWDLS